MALSMTGYGRCQRTIDGRDILVEIKSVNHRYLETSVKVPRAYSYIEDKVKKLASEYVSRGKIEIYVTINATTGKNEVVHINNELALSYINALKQASKDFGLVDDIKASTLLRFHDIFNVTTITEDEDVIWNDVKGVVITAMQAFVDMRKIEGDKMLEDIQNRLSTIDEFITQIEIRSPDTISNYKKRLTLKLEEVLAHKDIDENRVLTEVSIFAEKIAVDEETVRLKSHLKQFITLINEEKIVGRKLDFLVQEINREVNTIGSKSQDVAVTSVVVDLKAEIEKIREQIQNIE